MFKTHYRIVRDTYLGYEVQYKKWWFPFWIQAGHNGNATNTFSSIELAKEFIVQLKTEKDVIYYE